MKSWFNYIPLSIFLIIGYAGGELVSKWVIAWKVSSILAIFVLVFNFSKLSHSNRIFLGVNLFLILGGLLAWLNLGEWLSIYGGLFRGVSLFSVIAIVGIISTIFSKRGFINLGNIDESAISKYSWLLVAMAVLSGVISWLFRGNQLLEGTLPFVLLYVSFIGIEKKATQSQ